MRIGSHKVRFGAIIGFLLFVGASIGLALVLSGLQQLNSMTIQAPGEPDGRFPAQIGLSPLPTLTPAGREQNWPKANNWHVTPSPTDRVQFQAPKRIAAPIAENSRYQVELAEDKSQGSGRQWIRITNLETGQITQIGEVHGNESGISSDIAGTVGSSIQILSYSEQYVDWSLFCSPCDMNPPGLYVAALDNPEPHFVTDKYSSGVKPQFSDEWMVYAYHPSQPEYPLYRSSPFAQLIALNLISGKAIEVTPQAYLDLPGRFAVGSDWVVWVSVPEIQPNPTTLEAFNLETGERLTLDLPFVSYDPRLLQITGGLLVWFDEYWHGYDLARRAYFTVDAIPEELVGVDFSNLFDFYFDGNMLTWNMVVDGERRYYASELYTK